MRGLGYTFIVLGVLLMFTILLIPVGLMLIATGAVLVGVGTYVASQRKKRELDRNERIAELGRKAGEKVREMTQREDEDPKRRMFS